MPPNYIGNIGIKIPIKMKQITQFFVNLHNTNMHNYRLFLIQCVKVKPIFSYQMREGIIKKKISIFYSNLHQFTDFDAI